MNHKRSAYQQVISEAYPSLPVQAVHLHDEEGQYNDILIVNGEFIFRFPKYAAGVETIQNEVRILRRIKGRATLPVPDPIYTSKEEREVGKVFMGYQMLSGRPLWRETMRQLKEETNRQRLADQLARFLKELHSIPLQDLGDDIPVHDSVTEMEQLYTEVRTHLFRFMRPEARHDVAAHFEAYLETADLHQYPLALQHGDFGGSNILHDLETKTITGIIDFGFAGIGDPAQDIAAVSTYGDAFLERLYRRYPEIEAMVGRARFYRGTFALYEALHGFRNEDAAAFQAGMAQYI